MEKEHLDVVVTPTWSYGAHGGLESETHIRDQSFNFYMEARIGARDPTCHRNPAVDINWTGTHLSISQDHRRKASHLVQAVIGKRINHQKLETQFYPKFILTEYYFQNSGDKNLA